METFCRCIIVVFFDCFTIEFVVIEAVFLTLDLLLLGLSIFFAISCFLLFVEHIFKASTRDQLDYPQVVITMVLLLSLDFFVNNLIWSLLLKCLNFRKSGNFFYFFSSNIDGSILLDKGFHLATVFIDNKTRIHARYELPLAIFVPKLVKDLVVALFVIHSFINEVKILLRN